jgi:large subunit ribosomal protein L24
MKKEFTTAWTESRQPRKQRKFLYNLPLHLRQKQMSATLDKDLRKKYSIRNIEVRKGDEVSIMRGKFKKRVGKIVSVDVKRKRVTIENIQQQKKDGSNVNVWFCPSKLKIKVLDLTDKRRLNEKKVDDTVVKDGSEENKKNA